MPWRPSMKPQGDWRGTWFDLRLSFSPPDRMKFKIKTKLLRETETQFLTPNPSCALRSLPSARSISSLTRELLTNVPRPRRQLGSDWLCFAVGWVVYEVQGSGRNKLKRERKHQEDRRHRCLWPVLPGKGSWHGWPGAGAGLCIPRVHAGDA